MKDGNRSVLDFRSDEPKKLHRSAVRERAIVRRGCLGHASYQSSIRRLDSCLERAHPVFAGLDVGIGRHVQSGGYSP